MASDGEGEEDRGGDVEWKEEAAARRQSERAEQADS